MRFYGEYIGVTPQDVEYIISLRKIYAIYLHQDARVSLRDLFALSYRVRIYFIDARGNILGKVINYEKV